MRIQIALNWIRAGGSEVEGLEDLSHDLRAHLLSINVAQQPCAPQVLKVQRERVERVPRVPLVLGAVTGPGVVPGSTMPAVPLADGFDERRSSPVSRPLDRVARRFVDGQHVHAIDLHRRQPEALGPLPQ